MQNPVHTFETGLLSSGLILPGDKVFVACSGGPDSTALFLFLDAIRLKWKLKTGLIHFNHRFRGRESDADERFVRSLAKKHRVPFISGKRSAKETHEARKESLEEAGRRMRYGFFVRAAQKARIPKIALAHTCDDQAETVFMRMMQGTGVRGLSGIRPFIQQGGICFIRPLLDWTKQEILDYLKRQKTAFRLDSSNDSNRFIRNKIRNRIFPLLRKELNPRFETALARIPAIIRDEIEILDEIEASSWKKIFKKRSGRKIFLNRARFLRLPAALQFRMINQGLRKLDSASGLQFEAWQKIRQGLRNARFCHSLPKDIDFLLTPSQMIIYKKC